MKQNLSTEKCNEHNKANAAAIEAGLMEVFEPNDTILNEEAQAKKRKEVGFKEAQSQKAIMLLLDPATDGTYCLGQRVAVEKTYTRSLWHLCHFGWRLYIGSGYGRNANKSWVKIGDGVICGITTEQLAKAKALLAEVKARDDQENGARNEVEKAKARYVDFYNNNPKLVRAITELTHPSRFGEKYFTVEVNGSITFHGENFTVEQWEEITELRAEQLAALATLKGSFSKVN